MINEDLNKVLSPFARIVFEIIEEIKSSQGVYENRKSNVSEANL